MFGLCRGAYPKGQVQQASAEDIHKAEVHR